MTSNRPEGGSKLPHSKAAQRLDAAVANRHGVSRRRARKLIDDNRVVVNARVVSIASRTVRAGDRISVIGDDARIDVIKETGDYLVLNKPPNIATQPAREHRTPSLVEIAASLDKRNGGRGELFVIHRLDTGTSGVIVFAKNANAASIQLQSKKYLAIVEGNLSEPRTIDLPIARVSAAKFGVDEKGKPARTFVTSRAHGEHASLVEASIETGRTHQIRIHLAAIGHPVIGDRKYGNGGASRLLLHAWSVEHPSLGVLEAPPPDDFQTAARDLIRSDAWMK